ncbi:hypothetical protein, partial [Enterobacter hormaechei]|uniref:hypothetical protein n=1 Tax=Enterobacter hormaechei TaxID=158836 RepID=UPI001CAA84B5
AASSLTLQQCRKCQGRAVRVNLSLPAEQIGRGPKAAAFVPRAVAARLKPWPPPIAVSSALGSA